MDFKAWFRRWYPQARAKSIVIVAGRGHWQVECWEGGRIKHNLACRIAPTLCHFPEAGSPASKFQVFTITPPIMISGTHEVASEARPIGSAEVGPCVGISPVAHPRTRAFTIASITLHGVAAEDDPRSIALSIKPMVAEGVAIMEESDMTTLVGWINVGIPVRFVPE